MQSKNKKLMTDLLIILIFSCSYVVGAKADNNWITQAHLNVPKPGIVETTLSPDLHFLPAIETNQNKISSDMDLELMGPDQNPRSFELFWKEESGQISFNLESVNIELDNDLGLIWEGSIPQKIRVDHIRVIISDQKGMGRVKVQGLVGDEWEVLTQNAAIYKTGKKAQADIRIKPGEFKRFKFQFFGYDKKWQHTPLPIERIKVSGKKLGRGYVYDSFTPEFKQIKKNNIIEIHAELPGSGIWVDEISIKTQAQFQGNWSVGKEAIISGKRQYQEAMHGNLFWVKEEKGILKIKVNRKWPGQSMIIRLDPHDRFVGEIKSIDLRVRLPRLVFLADQPGIYTVRTGLDKPAKIRNIPGDPERRIQHKLIFVDIEKNKHWRPVDYVEKYAVMGGPMTMEGYSWKATIKVATPGVFQLVLNRQACMESNQKGIRLIKGETQIPFFDGAREIQEVDLNIHPDYDEKNNQTRWILQFPSSNLNWIAIQIEAQGIFNRQVLIETHKHGSLGWEKWKNLKWINRKKNKTKLKINMTSFPKDQKELRISMNHGDNQPLVLKRIQAQYPARTFIFMAQKAGEYEIVGGHPKAVAPVYDLSLVQDILLGIEPRKVDMGEVIVFKAKGFTTRLSQAFRDQGWGLYLVLGIVTLVLLVVIVKLFPKEE